MKTSPNWARHHSSKVIRRLEDDAFPWIGGRPIGEITAPELLAVLRRVESRGALALIPRTVFTRIAGKCSAMP